MCIMWGPIQATRDGIASGLAGACSSKDHFLFYFIPASHTESGEAGV
jgi:hypothetical protein